MKLMEWAWWTRSNEPSEGRQVPHVALHRSHVDAVVRRGLAVPLQLGLGYVQNGDLRAQNSEGGRLLPARAGQAEHVLARDVPGNTLGVHQGKRRLGVQV